MNGVSLLATRVAALAALIWLSGGSGPPAFAQDASRPVDERLGAVLAAECAEADIPGCVALISLPGGEVHTAVYGLASIEDGTPVEPGTLFRAGSITKTFVAVVALKLAADGVIDLDEPVYPYVEERAGTLRLSPDYQAVTFRHLLQHRAYIPDPLQQMTGVAPWLFGLLRGESDLADRPRLKSGEPFSPGERSRYTNTGYMVLGEALERAAGRSLGQLLDEYVFAPLGLEHTYYAAEAETPPQADGYVLENGEPRRVTFADSAVVAGAAGAILSNAADLERFAWALFEGGLLTEDHYAQLTDFVPTEGKVDYGLGLMRRVIEGRETLGHRGETVGYRSELLYLTDSGAVVVLLANLNVAPFRDLACKLLGELGL